MSFHKHRQWQSNALSYDNSKEDLLRNGGQRKKLITGFFIQLI